MEEQSVGVYGFYFKFLRNFGVFPYQIVYPGDRLEVIKSGPFKWFYYLNFLAVLFSASFQLAQILLTMAYDPKPMHVIGQLCWIFAIMVPFANYFDFILKEDLVVKTVNQWCSLEKTVIGSTLRTFSNMPQGPMPTMSNCHLAQNRLFKKSSFIYIILGLITVVTISVHCAYNPRFPAYIYSTYDGEDETLRYISIGYQIWLTIQIWVHSYAIEVLMIVSSNSIWHCIETLSYRGAVVMSNRLCDASHIDNVLIKNWRAFEVKSKEASKQHSAKMNMMKGDGKGMNHPDDNLVNVVQNVVDIQYALDRFKDVEATVDSINSSFGRIIVHHQGVYMALMCTLFFTPIRYHKIISWEGCFLFAAVAFYYLIRLFHFYPSMGRINRMTYTFVESWMEGLRFIPKGKYAYEFYMHKLDSCRKLAFDAGGFYIMQKGTVLTFVSIVTTHVIVLLQLY